MTKNIDTIWKADAHTIAKIELLSAYLKAWFSILGTARARRGQEILFVDGFAGPGEYTNHQTGSPIAAIEAATSVLKTHSGRWVAGSIYCAFIDNDQARIEHLERRLATIAYDRRIHNTIHATTFVEGLRAIRVARPRAFSLELTKQEFGIAGPKKSKQDGLVETTVEEWLGYQKTQNSEYTHRSYRSITKKFLTFLAEGKVTRLRTVTREVVMKYRRWCLKQGNSKVTVDNNLIALRSFFNWCVSRGEISTNPIAQQRHGEHLFFGERTERKEAYTRDEFEKILRAASGDDHRAFLLLGSWGTRISELTMLEWADIDAEGGWVHIRNKRTHDGIRYRPKDKTDRKLPLEGRHVHEVLDQLAARTGRQGYLLPLPKVKSRRDYAGRRFLEQLKRLSKTTGIPATKLTLHRFRRYFVSECADRGVPMTTTMEWVGHDELKMVLYYYSLRDEPAREAMRRLVGGAAPTAGGRSDRGHAAPQPSNHASGGHLKRSKSNRGRRRRIS